jgi:hypothetical protein
MVVLSLGMSKGGAAHSHDSGPDSYTTLKGGNYPESPLVLIIHPVVFDSPLDIR